MQSKQKQELFNPQWVMKSAAIFNWGVSASFWVAAGPVCKMLNLRPIPEDNIFLHMLCCLIGLFGFAFWQTAKNPKSPESRSFIRMSIYGKTSMWLLALYHFCKGTVSPQFFALAFGDLAYAGLFYKIL
jgi:hypothetical protein